MSLIRLDLHFCLAVLSCISVLRAAYLNPLTGTGNYSATSNNIKLVYWQLMGWLLHQVAYIEEGPGRGRSPPRSLLTVPNVTAHQSTANVPIIVLLYNGPLVCGFNVPIKGLMEHFEYDVERFHYDR